MQSSLVLSEANYLGFGPIPQGARIPIRLHSYMHQTDVSRSEVPRYRARYVGEFIPQITRYAVLRYLYLRSLDNEVLDTLPTFILVKYSNVYSE